MEKQCGCGCGQGEAGPSRRVVLGMMAAAAVAMPALSGAARAADAPAGGHWVKAGKPGDIADKTAKVIKGPDLKALAIVVREGNVIHAIAPKCTHKACDVAPVAGKELFHCKCHGAEFDFEGKNVRGPGKGKNVPASLDPLGHYAVRLDGDGVIEVDTSRVVGADAKDASVTIA
ncbi:MAG: ubiquinol-cytochrome c reductase iron-sulfur subunit [Phycisphaerae bacterium]